jgi:hypothetical protein
VSIKEIVTPTETALCIPFIPPLTPVQTAAMDLYRRGLNVFPVPNPFEVQVWAAEDPNERKLGDKPPYILKPLFYSRMHLCGPDCRQSKGRRDCLPENETFVNLFNHANLAVMMGRTSGNLLDIDCDSHKAFNFIGIELERRGLPFWAFTSHRGGGFLLRLSEGEAGNMPKDKCQILDVEVWGRSHYALLPPSLHSAGTVYQWVTPEPYFHLPMGEPPPIVQLDALDFLGVELALKQRPKWEEPELYGLPSWTLHLSRPNRKLLILAFVEGERNTNLTKPVYDVAALIIRGVMDYQEGERVLVEAARRFDYPISSISQMLKSALKKKPTPAREYKESNAYKPRSWQAARAFGMAFDWRAYGRRAQSRRAVFFACVERSRMDSSDVFRAAKREVAELAGCNDETALSALHELAKGGNNGEPPALLLRKGISEQSGARLYAFSDYALEQRARNPTIIFPCSISGRITRAQEQTLPLTQTEQDVFYRRAVAFRVWVHLKYTPEPSAAAIARAEALNQGSTRRALRWLVKHGLVTFGPAEGLYYGEHFTEDRLERLAAVFRTLGKSAKRKREHERDRERRINRQLARARVRWSKRYLDWRIFRG